MAKVIYRSREGGKNIRAIEGVAVDLLNGRTALVYPRYEELRLLECESVKKWNAEVMSEIEALRLADSESDTDTLLEAGSPAAGFVRRFASERFGGFQLPPLLAAMEVASRTKEIDEAVKDIEGTDKLGDYIPNVWSCSRADAGSSWFAAGCEGLAGDGRLGSYGLTVPLLLLPASWAALDT